jgi:hypothetical protein
LEWYFPTMLPIGTYILGNKSSLGFIVHYILLEWLYSWAKFEAALNRSAMFPMIQVWDPLKPHQKRDGRHV